MLWISSPVITTADEGTGASSTCPKNPAATRKAASPEDDNGSVDALAKEFKGQRWDADKSAWK
jgi:hypothetical protein